MKNQSERRLETQPIPTLVLSMSAPIMFTLLVQSMYNIVDSVCISAHSSYGMTAISLAFPLQLLLTAVGNGTGTGAGILISRALGRGEREQLHVLESNGLGGALLNWVLSAAFFLPILTVYYSTFSETTEVIRQGQEYTGIVIAASIFMHIESVCTRMIQARGNTFGPMRYQALGAGLNILLDPLLIFGVGPIPELGIQGAAIATVFGQAVAMVCALVSVARQGSPLCPSLKGTVLFQIYKTGLPSTLTSALVSAYITGLNMVFAGFSEDAVTSLGIYYKIQSFLLIPTYGLEQGTLPILSYNIGAKNYERVWKTFRLSLIVSTLLLIIGTGLINIYLSDLLTLFSAGPSLRATATSALRIISTAFPLFGVAILIPTLLQADGRLGQCLCIVILRQVVLLVPLAKFFSQFGLIYTWLTFPISELIAVIVCIYFWFRLWRDTVSNKKE